MSPVDIREMDVIGYDLAVPEPSSFVLLTMGMGLLVRRSRRGARRPLRPRSLDAAVRR